MKNRILFQCLNLTVLGLGIAAFAACAAGNDGGEGGGSNISSTTGVGTTGTDMAGPSSTTGSLTTGPDPAGGSTTSSAAGTPASTSSASTTVSTGSSTGEGGGGVTPPTDVTMIDDMEDGDNAITTAGGRQGYWYTYNDETADATQTPAAGDDFTMTTLSPARGSSTVAASTSGSGFTTWGAGMGFDLNSVEGVKSTYDASAFKGVTFWAKATAASSKALRVLLGDANTTPVAEGGACMEGDSSCYNHFARSVSLTEEWQQFTVEFAEPLDTTTLLSIQFQAGARDAFDIYVDDVGFYK